MIQKIDTKRIRKESRLDDFLVGDIVEIEVTLQNSKKIIIGRVEIKAGNVISVVNRNKNMVNGNNDIIEYRGYVFDDQSGMLSVETLPSRYHHGNFFYKEGDKFLNEVNL